MEEEVQKTIEKIDCRQKIRAESENYGGVQVYIWMVDDNLVEVR